jgi:hypothetical protein
MVRSRVVLSIAAVVALVAGLTLGAPGAAAATHRGHRHADPRIESPRRGALVTKATLKVGVRGGRAGFQALMGSRDVTRRFHHRGGVWSATLRRGRDFDLGRNRLQIQTKGGIAAREFLATRPRRGLLRLRRLPARVSLTALHVRGRTTGRIAAIRMTLNGRRVPPRLWPRGLRSFDGLLGADEGVRYGRNRLAVTVVTRGDRSQRVTRAFRVARRAPLAGAGADRRTKTGRRVRLDGTSTKAPGKGRHVSYSWRIVRAPRGSKAKLRHVHGAHPLLTPDRRGRYVVRLVASTGQSRTRSGPARPGAARASAVPTPGGGGEAPPSEPLPIAPPEAEGEPTVPGEEKAPPAAPSVPADAPTSATDQVTVVAAPAIKPIGMPVQTIAADGGIELGGTTYTTDADWVQVLVLDRRSLEVTRELGFDIDEASRLGTELATLKAQLPGSMVIMSGGDRAFDDGGPSHPSGGWSQANAAALETAMAAVGADFGDPAPLPEGIQSLDTGAWSVIGVLGTSQGSAVQNWGMSTGGAGKAGSLRGYMQLDSYGNYGFVAPAAVTVDTNVSRAKEGTNEIQVGAQTYRSGTLAQGYSGFQVLVLDSELGLVTNQTFVTDTPGGEPDTAGVQEMRNLLSEEKYFGPAQADDLVIVQSIGAPGGYDQNWVDDTAPEANIPATWGNTLAGRIGVLGGPAAHDQFAALVGSGYEPTEPSMQGGYTLIASTGLVDPYAGAVSVSQAGQRLAVSGVSGVLSRNRQSQWEMQSPSSSGTGFEGGNLAAIAYQPETAFPDNTGPYLAASEWIARKLSLDAPDVRTAYYEHFTAPWESILNELQALKCEAENGFTLEQCETLKAQLVLEFPMVNEVKTTIEGWQGLFSTSTVTGYVDLQTLSSNILREIQKYRESLAEGARLEVSGVAEAFAWMAQALVGSVPELEEAEPGLGVVASGLGMVGAFSDDAEGEPSTRPVVLPTTQLGQELVDRYKDMTDNLGLLGEILVSDWGKLQRAAALSRGEWSLSERARTALLESLEKSSAATDYTAMLPAAFGEYVLQWKPSLLNTAPWQHPWNYRCQVSTERRTEPFHETLENPGSYIVAARTFGPVGENQEGPIRQVRVMSSQLEGEHPEWELEHNPQVLPLSIAKELFGPAELGGDLGLDQFRFYGNPAFDRRPLECLEGKRPR